MRRGWRHYVRNWRGLTRRPPTTPSGPAVGCLEALRPLSEPGSRGPAGHRRCGRAPCCPDGRQVCAADQRRHPESRGCGAGVQGDDLLRPCFRRMKTTGLRIRPVYHWTAHRITSHIRLCVLALLLERAAEIRVGDTWRNLRLLSRRSGRALPGPWAHAGAEHALNGASAGLPQKLGVKPPPRVLSIESSSAPSCNT